MLSQSALWTDRVGEGAQRAGNLGGVPLASVPSMDHEKDQLPVWSALRPATKSPSFILLLHSLLPGSKDYPLEHLLCAPLGTQQHRAIALILVLWKLTVSLKI